MRDRRIARPLAIIHRKGRVLSPALKRFIALLIAGKVPAA
jgi:hypothetical protein